LTSSTIHLNLKLIVDHHEGSFDDAETLTSHPGWIISRSLGSLELDCAF